jgi:MFS transporter, SP family, sugar:H+ symporter
MGRIGEPPENYPAHWRGNLMAEQSGEQTNLPFVVAILAVATIGGLLFGYDSGAVNGTQDGLKAAFSLSESGLGFTVGSLLLGCMAGSFLAGRLADAYGRRNVMMIAAIMFLVGAIIQGFAHEQLIFVLARFMGGMAVGAASVLNPPIFPKSPQPTFAGG